MGLRCESTVSVARPAEEVFPWLLEADKVRRWMTGLQAYEPLDPGPLRVGSRIREELSVSGHLLRLELRVVELAPPRRALMRFEGSGFRAANEYTLGEADGAARVTWAISGDATSFKARLIVPMVQAKLQEKLDTDLARLRALLAGEVAAA